MPTISGRLVQIDDTGQQGRWIQVRTILPRGIPVRIRAFIGRDVPIARGSDRIPLSALREGELVEVSYHHGRAGLVEAESVSACEGTTVLSFA